MSTPDEAERYLDTAQAAKRTATVAALALIQAGGDANHAIEALGAMRNMAGSLPFGADIVSIAQQSIREAVEQAGG